MKSVLCYLIHIYEVLSFFLAQYLPGILYLDFPVLHLLRSHISENITDGNAHAFITHIKIVGLRRIRDLDLYILFFKQSLSELLSHLLSGKFCIHFGVFFRVLLLLLLILLFLTYIPAVAKYEIKRPSVFAVGYLFLLSRYYRFYYFFFHDFISYGILFLQHSLLRYPY